MPLQWQWMKRLSVSTVVLHFRHSSCVPGRICENRRRQSKVSLVLCRPGPTTVWSPAGHKVFGNLVLPVEGRRSPRKTSTTRRTSQVSWHKPGSPRDTGQVARGPKDGLDGSDQGRQRSLSSLPGRMGRSRPAEKLPHFSGSRVSLASLSTRDHPRRSHATPDDRDPLHDRCRFD